MLQNLSVFDQSEIKDMVKSNNIDKEYLDYLFSYPDNLEKSIYQYVETKTLSKFLVDYVKDNGYSVEFSLYRGDYLYEGFVEKGSRFRLWNSLVSFTKELLIARKFANIACVPDWYYAESEWCLDVAYPFKKSLELGESLVPIIIKINGDNDLLKVFSTEHYLNRFEESEYIMYVRDLEFEFVDIVDNIEGVDVWLVQPVKNL